MPVASIQPLPIEPSREILMSGMSMSLDEFALGFEPTPVIPLRASLGVGAPARLGVSILKVARRTGRLTAQMGEWLTRTMRQVVDWSAMRRDYSAATDPSSVPRDGRCRGSGRR